MKKSSERNKFVTTNTDALTDIPVKQKLSETEKRAIKPGIIYKCDNPEDEDSGTIPMRPKGTEIHWTSPNPCKNIHIPDGKTEIIIKPESKKNDISYLYFVLNKFNYKIKRVDFIINNGIRFSIDDGSHENNFEQALRFINHHYNNDDKYIANIKVKQIKLTVE